jgi:hypothetical protein
MVCEWLVCFSVSLEHKHFNGWVRLSRDGCKAFLLVVSEGMAEEK